MHALFRLSRALARWTGVAALAGSAAVGPAIAADKTADGPVGTARELKILHVMSHHSPWRWTDGQLQGFKDGLAAPAQFKVFQIDAKRQSTPEEMQARAREARAAIDRWKPDLLYTSDDEAQDLVARHYVNTELPVVFSGVNKPPQSYGFDGAPNVTGVLEHEHSLQSIRLLQALAPGARRFVAVFDEAPLWPSVQARMKAATAGLADVEFVAWDTVRTFEEYKTKVKDYQTGADAIALIGVFNFKDEQGKNVPYQQVMR